MREINNVGSLAFHELTCKENPNKISYGRSPYAGAKKGNVPWNKGTNLGRGTYWDEKYPLESVCVVNSTYARHALKQRIIDNDLIPYVCAICGLGPWWQNKQMLLVLDHINGINNDNRLENLRFVCSNCDSQLPTYKKRKRLDG